jgi:DNA-directed RNA polymerase specialized sigma24 family protein
MENQDALRFGKRQLFNSEDLKDLEGELLHDYKGTQYLINDRYFEKEKEKRHSSTDKEIALQAAAHLLRTNLEQLTDKQKRVIIGVMEGKSLRRISKEMKIHFTTVQEHLEIARRKLAGLINKTKEVITNEEDIN